MEQKMERGGGPKGGPQGGPYESMAGFLIYRPETFSADMKKIEAKVAALGKDEANTAEVSKLQILKRELEKASKDGKIDTKFFLQRSSF